jgi:hypothetical protein
MIGQFSLKREIKHEAWIYKKKCMDKRSKQNGPEIIIELNGTCSRWPRYIIAFGQFQILCCNDRGFWNEFYNDQRNAQVLNLFIYLLLPYTFRAFF